MDDLISRQAAIDALASRWGLPVILTEVNDGPSVLYPFSLEGNSSSQFIREIIDNEPEKENK